MSAMAVALALALALVAGDATPAAPRAPPGDAAAETPSRAAVSVAPADARPGDALLVRVRGAAAEPSGAIAGRPLAFWRANGEWRALGALPIETAPGPLPVSVEADGGPLEARVTVVDPGFAVRALTVAPRFVEPPRSVQRRIDADRRAFAAAYDRGFAAPRFEAGFVLPREARVSARYGDQRVLNGKKESVHYGLDLTGPRGAPVHAAAAGEVVLARDAYLSGKSVVLWHGADVFTIYFHLDRIEVRPGAEVKRGQRIGRLGSTGRSTGPHLHWSARVAGLLVDPESLLAIDFAAGTAPPRRPGALSPPAAAEPSAEGAHPAPEGHEDPPVMVGTPPRR
jgi:murein DD-endopeptidase MepM/ murein hydrolase activator NlpD